MTTSSAPSRTDGQASLDHVLAQLDTVETAVRGALAGRRASPASGPFAGLCLSSEQVEQLLEPRPPPTRSGLDRAGSDRVTADGVKGAGHDLRLHRLARDFDLAPLDVDLLLVALAPEVDGRYERLYGYLHDDLTRRRASIGLALELCGVAATDASVRARLGARAPLVLGGLLAVQGEGPFLSRALVVPDRVVQHLLGDDAPDAVLADLLVAAGGGNGGQQHALAGALAGGVCLTYVREEPGADGRALAAAAYAELERDVLAVDLTRCAAVAPAVRAALREARLTGAALVVGPVEVLAAEDPTGLRTLTEQAWPVVLTGLAAWDPAWSRCVPLLAAAPALTPLDRLSLWDRHLGEASTLETAAAAGAYRLSAEQIGRAATAARLQASYGGRDLAPEDVRDGARSQNAAGLERHARRLVPRATWDDLVLPPCVSRVLRDLPERLRWRDAVYEALGVRRGNEAVTAMFTGPPGTGKSMAAEVVAGELGLDLYVVDLARVIDKYIGETEKNLDRVFSEAERVNGVLLFDEADALFGKRSEVRDAHDRYANVETAYLLQRLEAFDGIAILTSNLANNLDEAFARRLDAVVDFPLPDEPFRLQLWQRALGRVDRDDGVDLAFCARAFELSGGHIRNVAVTAAFLAAAAGRPLVMADLVQATAREYRKLGRLCSGREFGPYVDLLA